jgi:MFS family permease
MVELPASKSYDVLAAVALSLCVQTFISLLAGCVPVLAPEIAKAHGWNVNVITFYPVILYLAAFLISFYVPHLLGWFGGMGLSVLCLLISAVGLLGFLAPNLAVAAAGAVIFGFTNGAMNPASSQVLGPRTSPSNAGLIMSIKQTGVPLGAMLAGLLAPFLVLYWGWQSAVIELAAGGAVFACLVLPTVRWMNGPANAAPARQHRLLEPLKRLRKIPGMMSLLVAGMAFAAMQLCLRSFFTVYLVSKLGFSLTAAGFAFGASQAAGIVGQIAWATISDRLVTAHAVMAILGIIMAAASILTAIFTPDWPLTAVTAVAALYGLTAAGFIPVVLGEVARRADPGDVGALTSGAQLFLISGVIIGPFAFGGVASAISYSTAFIAMAAWVAVVSLVLAMSGFARRVMIRR